MGALILLVEGKRAGTRSLQAAIKKAGHSVIISHTGSEALELVKTQQPQLVVFDASTMRSNGVRSCRRIHKRLEDVPIIHCRAEDMPLEESAEADVYLQLPFTPRKLLNRVRALLPAEDTEDQIVRVGPITLYLGKRSVHVVGRGEHTLTPKLTGLLHEMMLTPNEVITRKQIMRNVWKTDFLGDTRTLDVHIRWIREIVEANPKRPRILKTVRGQGYMLKIN